MRRSSHRVALAESIAAVANERGLAPPHFAGKAAMAELARREASRAAMSCKLRNDGRTQGGSSMSAAPFLAAKAAAKAAAASSPAGGAARIDRGWPPGHRSATGNTPMQQYGHAPRRRFRQSGEEARREARPGEQPRHSCVVVVATPESEPQERRALLAARDAPFLRTHRSARTFSARGQQWRGGDGGDNAPPAAGLHDGAQVTERAWRLLRRRPCCRRRPPRRHPLTHRPPRRSSTCSR